MISHLSRFRRTTKGASMVSYGIITGLIGVLAVVSVNSLGTEIRNTFVTTDDTLSGQLVTATNDPNLPGGSLFANSPQTGEEAQEETVTNDYPNQIAFEFSGPGSISYYIGSDNPGEELIVDYGDGTPPSSLFATGPYDVMMGASNITHTYSTPGPHIMTITGPVTYMSKTVYGDTILTDVLSFGDTLTNTSSLFAQEQDINNLPALPDSLVIMSRMFKSSNLTGTTGYGNWNTSNIEDLTFLFGNAVGVEQDITQWDVSSVRIFYGTFQNADDFNQDISTWTPTSAIYMGQMFWGNESMTYSMNSWDVSGVTNCQNFNRSAPNITPLRPNFTSCSP